MLKLKDLGDNNKIIQNQVTYNNVQIIFQGNNNYIEIEENSKLSNLKVWLRGSNNKVIIGKNSIVKGALELLRNNSTIKIGNNTSIGEGAHFITDDGSSITIGDDCMFASRVTLRGTDGHPIWCLETGERLNSSEDIQVCDYVWLAQDVTVLKGTQVGMGSIIGKDAVVTKDIPNMTSAAGIPARVLRTNITWGRTVNPKKLEQDKTAMKYVNLNHQEADENKLA